MLAAIGVALLAGGWVIVKAFGCPFPRIMNWADYTGSNMMAVGLILIIASLIVLCWRHLP